MNKLAAYTLFASAFSCQILYADSEFINPEPVLNSETGVIQVYVEDDNGTAVVNAPIYVSDGRKILTIVETGSLGSVAFDLQKGNYLISSAIIKPIVDSIDRYASPVARIQVAPKDTSSVVLRLHLVEDAISNLSSADLEKIGIADKVAQYIN